MGRTLNTTLLLDGVLYPVGTDESDVRGEVTAAGVWDGDDELHPNTVLFEKVVQDIARFHRADPDAPLGPLFLDVLEEQDVDLPQPDAPATPAGDEQGDQSAGYVELSKPALEAEIDKRNTDRDPAGETYIRPEGRNKPDLVAALVADDARTAAQTPEG